MKLVRPLCLGLCLAACAGLSVSVALGPNTPKGTQPVVAHTIAGSPECIACHGVNYDQTHFVEPGDTWAGTVMAHSARDPLFWAAVDVANHDVPGIGDLCLRCHAPGAWLDGRSEPPGGSPDGCGLAGVLDDTFASDFDGVTCHLCHRMMVNPAPPPGEQPFYVENAQFWVDDSDCGGQGEPCRRAQYDYLGPHEPAPPHSYAASPYHESSDLCGTCHNVTNPALDLIVNGVDQGVRFPIERTHREWEQSDYAVPGPGEKPCQVCHMPDTDVNPVYACAFKEINRTADMGLHSVVGGNSWIPEVLRQIYPTLLLDTELAAIRDEAVDLLTKHTAGVEVLAPSHAQAGTSLGVAVKVTNLTGHKLPTGYPEGRRMWLHVTARDGAGATLWESGAYNPSTGVLTADPALKIYRAEHGQWNRNGGAACDRADGQGRPIFHFAANNCVAVDNRIPPLGFRGGADVQTRPVGYVYPETWPGSGVLVNYDVTPFSIPVPPQAVSPITVEAQLQYQTTSKEYVEFQRDEALAQNFPNDCLQRSTGPTNTSRGAFLYTTWDSHGKSAPVTVKTVTGSTALVTAVTPGEAARAAPMRVTTYDRGTGEVTISYTPACGAADHTVYVGALAGVATMTFGEQVCARGASGATTFHLGSGNLFWVVVGSNGVEEGSYGKNSSGVERPSNTALATCPLPQNLSRSCDP